MDQLKSGQHLFNQRNNMNKKELAILSSLLVLLFVGGLLFGRFLYHKKPEIKEAVPTKCYFNYNATTTKVILGCTGDFGDGLTLGEYTFAEWNNLFESLKNKQ